MHRCLFDKRYKCLKELCVACSIFAKVRDRKPKPLAKDNKEMNYGK